MSIFDKEAILPDEVEEVHELRKDASKHQADWRTEARQCFEFVAGSQWDDDDRALLESQHRPCVTFNRVGPMVDSVVGYEINNRREVKYKPRTLQDREVNAVYSEAARWVRQLCDAEDEESDAFRDCIISGMGWIETRVDYDEDPEGQIVMERVSPLEMRWDPAARKNNLADAKWVMREKWWDLDDVREKWPDADITPGDATLDDTEWLDQHDATEAWKYENNASWWDPKEGRVLVIQHQYCEMQTYYIVADEMSGRVVEFSEERWNRISDRVNLPHRKVDRKRYYQRIICGDSVLEDGKAPIADDFSFHCMTGKRDEEEGLWYGIVRAMLDPQRWANSFFSTAMHAMHSNSKGGLIIEKSAVGGNMEDLQDRWADPRGIVEVEDGALTGGQLQEKSFGGYPPSLDKLMSFAIQGIRDVTGINMELLGMVGHEQSGVLEIERKKSALTILAPLINSVKRYRKMQGGALLTFMRKYIKPGTIMRLTDREVPFWGDDATIKYDVVVDDAPTSPNLKNEVWQAMQQILPAALRAGMPVPPDIIKFSPLPDSVADTWVEYINKQSQAPDMDQIQQQMEQMQAEMQKLQKENMTLKDKREAEMMSIQARQKEAEMEMMISQQKMALDAKQHEMEMAQKMQISDADRAAKLLEIEARYNTEMARIKSNSEVQLSTSQGQIEAQRESAVISLQSEREKRQLEREVKLNDEVNPYVSQIKKTDEKVDKLLEDMEERQKTVDSQRQQVLQYLKSRGGEVAALARQLDE